MDQKYKLYSIIYSFCNKSNLLNPFESEFEDFEFCLPSDQVDEINDQFSLENGGNDGVCVTELTVNGEKMLVGKNNNLQGFWIDGDQNNCYDDYLGTNQMTIQNGQGMFQN